MKDILILFGRETKILKKSNKQPQIFKIILKHQGYFTFRFGKLIGKERFKEFFIRKNGPTGAKDKVQ